RISTSTCPPWLCSSRATTSPSPPLLPVPHHTSQRCSATGQCHCITRSTADPACSINSTSGMLYRSMALRSIWRICATLLTFIFHSSVLVHGLAADNLVLYG